MNEMSKTDILIKKVFSIFLSLGYKVNEMFFEHKFVDLVIYLNNKVEWIVKVTTDTINPTKKFDIFEKLMIDEQCTKGLVINQDQFIFYNFYFSKDGRYTNDTRDLFFYASTQDVLNKLKEITDKIEEKGS